MRVNARMENVDSKSFIKDYLSLCGVDSPLRYLRAGERDLESTDRYLNITDACATIKNGIQDGAKFGLLVDVDADGYASSAIAYQFLESQGVTPKVYHHTAKQHGLHTNERLVERIIRNGIGVLWIPDAGTNDVNECRELKENGVKVVITDHHESEVQNPYAVIVNNMMGEVGNRGLSGAGVTAKVVEHYCKMYGLEPQDYSDLVALSLVSDSCDMTEIENRAIYNMVYGGRVRE